MINDLKKTHEHCLIRNGKDELPDFLRQCSVCEGIKPLVWYCDEKAVCSKCVKRQQRNK